MRSRWWSKGRRRSTAHPWAAAKRRTARERLCCAARNDGSAGRGRKSRCAVASQAIEAKPSFGPETPIDETASVCSPATGLLKEIWLARPDLSGIGAHRRFAFFRLAHAFAAPTSRNLERPWRPPDCDGGAVATVTDGSNVARGYRHQNIVAARRALSCSFPMLEAGGHVQFQLRSVRRSRDPWVGCAATDAHRGGDPLSAKQCSLASTACRQASRNRNRRSHHVVLRRPGVRVTINKTFLKCLEPTLVAGLESASGVADS